ncbi:MAG: CAAX prenyl protease-related protein [Acaryochloridaceae cyanobacterium SU_2_1]|nr:CAAX prenyl protease-related protein [Acaryochloridaceae cyanobacterium SU_2_1]
MRQPWFPYVVPMATFMLFTTLESFWPHAGIYPWLYGAKVGTVSLMLAYFAQPWQEIRPQRNITLLALVVGLIVFAEWILLDQWIPYPHLGTRLSFNPFAELRGFMLPLFLALRCYGLVVMVPIMEEIFWRSFLLRYLSVPDFRKIPLGSFTGVAFAITAVLFGLLHSEWLVAILAGLIYALLLKTTRSLYACIVAHSTTNLALGIYVIATQSWQYW